MRSVWVGWRSVVELVAALDAHFAWMLAPPGPASFDGLMQPEGGVDTADIISLLQGIANDHHAHAAHGMWLIVQGREVAGLCGYLARPSQGSVEIGYGIAASCRRRGLATQAVAELLRQAARDGIGIIRAATAVANVASQLVLQRNGFSVCGERVDPEDGAVFDWHLPVSHTIASTDCAAISMR